MTGNAVGEVKIVLFGWMLAGDDTPCDQCDAPLNDHEWVALDQDDAVIECSGAFR